MADGQSENKLYAIKFFKNNEYFLIDYNRAKQELITKVDNIIDEFEKIKKETEKIANLGENQITNEYRKYLFSESDMINIFDMYEDGEYTDVVITIQQLIKNNNNVNIEDRKFYIDTGIIENIIKNFEEIKENIEKDKNILDSQIMAVKFYNSFENMFDNCKILSCKVNNGKVIKNEKSNDFNYTDMELSTMINSNNENDYGRDIASIILSFAHEFNNIDNIEEKVVINTNFDKLPIKINKSKFYVERYCKNIQQILKKNPKAKYIIGGCNQHAFLIEIEREINSEKEEVFKLHIKDSSGAFTKQISRSTGKTNYEHFLEYAKSLEPGIVFDTNEKIQQMQDTQGKQGFCSYNELGLLKTCLDRDEYNNDIDEYNKDKDEKDKKPKLTDDEFEYNKAINILLHSSGKHMLSYENNNLYEFNENGTRGKIPYNKIGETVFKASLGDEESRNKINAIQNEEIRNNLEIAYTQLERFLSGENEIIIAEKKNYGKDSQDQITKGYLNGVLNVGYLSSLQEKANNILQQDLEHRDGLGKIEKNKEKERLQKQNENIKKREFKEKIKKCNSNMIKAREAYTSYNNPDELFDANTLLNLIEKYGLKDKNKELELSLKNQSNSEFFKISEIEKQNKLMEELQFCLCKKISLQDNDKKLVDHLQFHINYNNKIIAKSRTEEYSKKLKELMESEYYEYIDEQDKKMHEQSLLFTEKKLNLEKDKGLKSKEKDIVDNVKDSKQQTEKTNQQQVPLSSAKTIPIDDKGQGNPTPKKTEEQENEQKKQAVNPIYLPGKKCISSEGHSQAQ